MRIRNSDPDRAYHFDPDPYPAYHFDPDPDRILIVILMRIRIQILPFTLMRMWIRIGILASK
jgi:hypothetical protein